jgi:hypothetical protein
MAARPTLWQQPGVRRWLYLLYGIPLSGYGNVIGSTLYVLGSVPAGASIRPMGLVLYMLLVAGFTTLLGIGFGVTTIVKWPKVPLLRVSGILCLLLSLPQVWVDMQFFHWFCEIRGLVLSD